MTDEEKNKLMSEIKSALKAAVYHLENAAEKIEKLEKEE